MGINKEFPRDLEDLTFRERETTWDETINEEKQGQTKQHNTTGRGR